MTPFPKYHRAHRAALFGSALVALTACQTPLDFDMRGINGGFSTADAAQAPAASRPQPDDRGVISYPNYQVAVARNGETIQAMATRLNLSAPELARYNGVEPDVPLRRGEVIALPRRVAEPSPATGAIGTGPIQPGSVDINTLAGDAINRAPASSGVQTAALPPAAPTPAAQSGREPVRHKVVRGETAFTVARLYQVSVKSLAEWNGLGPDFAIREGQFLLIPVPQQNAPKPVQTAVTQPGVGTPTPTPPSAAKPLPQSETPPVAAPEPVQPAVTLGPQTTASNSRLAFPVTGSIVREYSKGKNEGIDIKSDPGSTVKSADAGTVAAITQSADGVPIVVVRHDDNLLTVYANVTDVSVAKGDKVSRGQGIAKLRGGNNSFVHFEVRKGFDSVDPLPFLQ